MLSIYSGGKLIASTTEEHPFYVQYKQNNSVVASVQNVFYSVCKDHPVSKGQYVAGQYVAGQYVAGQYVAARKLKAGDRLLSRLLPTVLIDSVFVKDTLIRVYNFEVTQWHNYLVGEQAVLVHNAKYFGGKYVKDIITGNKEKFGELYRKEIMDEIHFGLKNISTIHTMI
ncbi:polymorphic toxin-type HINT domain-containing protein [Cytophagaceae bacterium DM2B3-1]|uniref:Polymorphic toxin-type HINT domain-containing protein n=1 Tax=Xanthocytophaga flava TaxID=3048013 RepID=A0ABT7CFE7_9BACT|nr:polymorphic toxin-type HINT domain-containing protein [Xanthocytophaga flavus]MDJ1492451.1 polymorphic toxin-type HINT domain-containing protein [Xanthocytophaga flavus]